MDAGQKERKEQTKMPVAMKLGDGHNGVVSLAKNLNLGKIYFPSAVFWETTVLLS